MCTHIKLLLILCFFSTSVFAQNKGAVKGTIQTSDGQPAAQVNVALKGTSRGATTDDSGQFEIKNVEAGKYLLVTSFIGLETKEQPVEVVAGQVTQVAPIQLSESSQHLNEIVVSDAKINAFDRKESEYVAKLPLKNIENPQVYNTISAELLKDQVSTNFNDAIKNAPGISRLWESTGRGGDGAGYFSLRGFAVQPTLINGLPGLTNGGLDIANIERLEVVKGPSGTLYGSSLVSYGGLINIITKKPYYHRFGGEVSYNTGSFGLNRVTADINAPLSKIKNIALRVNTAYHSEQSFQDAGFKNVFFFAPSFAYEVDERLSFLINTEFMMSESTNQTMLFLDRNAPLTVTTIEKLGYDSRRSYTSNNLSIKNPTFSMQAQMNYKFSPSWRSQTVVSRSSGRSDGYYSYLYEVTRGSVDQGSVFQRYLNKQNASTLTTDIQQNFIGDFRIGTLRNRLVAGLDYYHLTEINNSTGYGANGRIYIGQMDLASVNEQVFGITDPESYVLDHDSGILSEAATDVILAGLPVTNSKAEQEVFSAYVSDVINLTPALSTMVSVRIDRFINKDNSESNQTAVSPKFGVVYQLLPEQISVFANYMNGFTNVAPRAEGDGDVTIRTFEPEQANQLELGIKTDLLDGKISATLSAYDIEVSNVVRQDPERVNFFIQDGENYSRGVEFSVIASPVDGLNLVAGYSYNESKITKTDSENYRNRRPEGAGPAHMANAWLSYRFNNGTLNGFGLGIGGNYASKYATLNRAITGTFYLPSYTVLNAAVSYDTESFRVALKLDNLNDEIYYTGWSTINPQRPRNFTASFTYRF